MLLLLLLLLLLRLLRLFVLLRRSYEGQIRSCGIDEDLPVELLSNSCVECASNGAELLS